MTKLSVAWSNLSFQVLSSDASVHNNLLQPNLFQSLGNVRGRLLLHIVWLRLSFET